MKIRGFLVWFAWAPSWPPAAAAADRKATPEEARKFIDDAEQKLLALGVDAVARGLGQVHLHHRRHRSRFPQSWMSAPSTPRSSYAKQATRFDGLTLDP